ncbi:MAG: hypothetical protein ABI954_03640 [Pyrinomonadaceae bacterium]
MNKKNTEEPLKQSIFNSLRKPLAPPSRAMGSNKSNDKARPARRKIKHKKPITTDEE